MLRGFIILCVFVTTLTRWEPCVSAEAKDRGDWWVAVYGAMTEKDHPYVARVNRIFNKVFTASDKRANRYPRLVILRYAGDPWAISLKDGTILLTQKAMEFCYKGVSGATGDSRVAFVLGHELAHLAKDDFWHFSAFENITKFGDRSQALEEILELLRKTEDITDTREAKRIVRKKELQADAYGLLYASMAGFEPDRIVSENGDNFIREWAEQITGKGACSEGIHPSPEKRAAFLLSNIRAVKNDIDLFHIGVRLYQIGRYEDALDFFNSFNERFPCREVFNNIGLIYYQSAMRKLAECDTHKHYRFKLSTVVDTETMAEVYRGRCGDSIFSKSIRYFKMACEKDTRYLPARVNLSSALIMSGRYSEAVAVLDEAAHIRENAPEVLNNRAVALYLMGPEIHVDLYDQASQLLKGVVSKGEAISDACFNLARLRQERERKSGAMKYWEIYLNEKPYGDYSDHVRAMLRKRKPARQLSSGKLQLKPRVSPGLMTSDKSGKLKHLAIKPLEFGNLAGAYYSGENESAVVLEDVVELYEQKVNIRYRSFKRNLNTAVPLKTFNSVSGVTTVVYDNFALDVSGDTVQRVVWFEQGYRGSQF